MIKFYIEGIIIRVKVFTAETGKPVKKTTINSTKDGGLL